MNEVGQGFWDVHYLGLRVVLQVSAVTVINLGVRIAGTERVMSGWQNILEGQTIDWIMSGIYCCRGNCIYLKSCD